MSLLITCESGGTVVPAEFRDPNTAKHQVMPQHSLGSQATPEVEVIGGRLGEEQLHEIENRVDHAGRYAAEKMANCFGAELFMHSHAAELIDVSRSLHHRQLFSELTRAWPIEARKRLVETVYEPYRDRVRGAVRGALAKHNFLVHLSVSSFSLRRGGKIRRADAGLLYDPSRKDESDLCHDWVYELWYRAPMLKVRRNYPRRGTSDSLARTLRSEFGDRNYLGIEVLLNRAWSDRKVAVRDEAIAKICESLQAVLEESESTAQAA